MTCGACGQRKARRTCPALQQQICPACCGGKRLVEIACPPDCTWLAAAQQHPAAAVRRQHEGDLRQLLDSTGALTEWQFQLFFLVHAALSRFRPDAGRLLDVDVAEAAGALAGGYEAPGPADGADRGPQGGVGRQLAAELRVVLDDVITRGGRRAAGDAAVVLRAVERGARTGGAPTAYLDLIARVLREGQGRRPPAAGLPDGAPTTAAE